MSGVIRVLLAEDMHLVRGALAALLSLEPDIDVVAQVDRGDAIVPAARQAKPDVAVLDIDLPGMDGLTAAVQIQAELPACRIVMLTGYAKPGNLIRALRARVGGFLPKDASPEMLSDAVRRVHRGERVLDAEMAAAAFLYGPNPLSGRECDVLSCLAEGAEVSEIAARLFLAPGTVRNHVSSIMLKLHARNRVDAVRIAADRGWLFA
jgi:two-component system response regulator DesR